MAGTTISELGKMFNQSTQSVQTVRQHLMQGLTTTKQ